MSKYTFLIFAGLLIALLPHLGFPSAWDTFMYTVIGVCITVVSVFARKQFKNGAAEVAIVEKQPVYVESTPRERLRRSRGPRSKVPKVDPQSDVVLPPYSSAQTPPVNMAE